jgi:hypothetical protein
MLTLTAIRSKMKEGRYKGMNVTHIFKDDNLYAVFPPESRQPKYGSQTITLNCWKWKLNWAKS